MSYLSFLICEHGTARHCYVNGLPIGIQEGDSFEPERRVNGDKTIDLGPDKRLAGTGRDVAHVVKMLREVADQLEG